MSKYVKKLTDRELLERMAEDLVEMHKDTGIDLGYWETGREIVERFYNITNYLEIGDKK